MCPLPLSAEHTVAPRPAAPMRRATPGGALAVPEPHLADLRQREFARLDTQRLAYVDYGGTALPPASLLRAQHERLQEAVFGNPHSEHAASRTSTASIDAARAAVLRLLDADPADYVVCFTANASAGLRLVGESYPFGPFTPLVLSADNHNSVNGLREFAQAASAPVRYVGLDAELRLEGVEEALTRARRRGGGLFAFPAQSNFSGVHHPLDLVERAQLLGYDVLVDAAAFLPTNRLRLREILPDFLVLSLHKIVGYPVQGALVARRDALAKLRRPWFAGGTVEIASVLGGTHILRRGEAGFEDGTPDFLGLAAVADGLGWLDSIGVERVHRHVMSLTAHCLYALEALRYGSGQPMVRLYGPATRHARGACIAFNVIAPDGTPVSYETVERHAAAVGIALRGGCFCNPGAAESAFGFERQHLAACLERARHEGFVRQRLAACLPGRAVGALRVSFGAANNEADIDRAVAAVKEAAITGR